MNIQNLIKSGLLILFLFKQTNINAAVVLPSDLSKSINESRLHPVLQDFHALATSQDGKILASGDLDGKVKIWDLASEACIYDLDCIDPEYARSKYTGGNAVFALAFNQDGNILAICGYDRQDVRILDLKTKTCKHMFDVRDVGPSSNKAVAFSPNGSLLAFGNNDGNVELWDMNAKRCIQVLKTNSWIVKTVVFSSDGRRILVEMYDGRGIIWTNLQKFRDLATQISNK